MVFTENAEANRLVQEPRVLPRTASVNESERFSLFALADLEKEKTLVRRVYQSGPTPHRLGPSWPDGDGNFSEGGCAWQGNIICNWSTNELAIPPRMLRNMSR
jgi:hypothetical protein